jgi:valyl-tRNA synthetase
MADILDKSYDPALFERRWYAVWEERGYFTAANPSDKSRFSIVIPPPNVTGTLHMGHALQHTLHDILVRWKRMSGFNTLWLPGMDHASIAVHFVLDKQLEAEKKSRFDLGRDRFLEIAWQWKETSGGTILNQMRRMGVSCDWTRERFTLDPGLSHAVQECFVRLFEEGLIYRGEYMVNWCPRCNTAISDLEVAYQSKQGKLWYLRYPLLNGGGHVIVATTRPETMLGDTAVAVHPEDERYRHLIGTHVLLPVMNREIPVIADEIVDREFGTGAVKVTPAHDTNDYEMSRRHGLPKVTVIDSAGKMTPDAGPYAGMDRFECRAKLVRRLVEEEYLVKETDYEHNVGHCDRCSTVVEPKISMQWFLKVDTLAKPAIEVVENGSIQFIPDAFKKRYFEWMYNIHDWCISRQLWWGHRIPAWYCDACGEIMVARTAPGKCRQCDGALRQETDILDTWFSSALWPFSTLGWPDDTPDLRLFYPTDVLITGPDIIFFWVARMIMMGLKFIGDVPFRQVHINGIVRDASHKKMSKTRGNVIEPLELIEEYGADAVRFTLSSMAVPGTDIPFSSDRMKGYSAFANKVWNAARFVLMNLQENEPAVTAEAVDDLLKNGRLPLEDRWILHRLNQVSSGIAEALEKYRFHDASSLIYQFIWHELCDWYIELVKPVLVGEDAAGATRAERIAVLVHVLDYSLRLLHPFMPFITEEIWQRIPHVGESIMTQAFPLARSTRENPEAARDMEFLMDLTVSLRSARAEMNVEPKKVLDAAIVVNDAAMRQLLLANLDKIRLLARLKTVELPAQLPAEHVQLKGVWKNGEFGLNLEGAVDFKAERERIRRELNRLGSELQKVAKKLSSHEFMDRAPEEIVAENRARHAELRGRYERLESNLNRLPQE